jgi:hypothetical protein
VLGVERVSTAGRTAAAVRSAFRQTRRQGLQRFGAPRPRPRADQPDGKWRRFAHDAGAKQNVAIVNAPLAP